MALSFVVSYTFSPSTTISSSQVNTNTSDVAAVFQGLEAETKTLAKLKVDIDPTTALEVATKQYVDHYSTYRRPNLIWGGNSAVNMETGINGTSGQAQILFPDGSIRTDSTTSRINLDTTRVAALSGTAQSGIQTSTVSANTWYACYAVKVTDSSTNFVMVADKTNFPIQSKYATLNSNFGTSGWVYLGMMRYGDNSGGTGIVLSFIQTGNRTSFRDACTGQGPAGGGIRLATSAGATTLTYTYAAGNGAAQIPDHITIGTYQTGSAASTAFVVLNAAQNIVYIGSGSATAVNMGRVSDIDLSAGLVTTTGSSVAMDIYLAGWIDPVLGVGSNPLL